MFIYGTEKKTWERGIVRHQTEQPNQYSIQFDTGRIADRNCVHLKPDVTTPATIQDSQLSTTSDSEFPSTPLQGLLPEPKTHLAMPDLTQTHQACQKPCLLQLICLPIIQLHSKLVGNRIDSYQ